MNQTNDELVAWRRTGGRSARNRRAVLQAVLDLLVENGDADMTFNAIACKAGVHASSIQRRWGTRENVILDAVLTLSQQKLPTPDTGSLREDLIIFAREMAEYLSSAAGAAVVRALAATAGNSISTMNHTRLVELRYEAAKVMIGRAADRGELREGVDWRISLELLVGALLYRMFTAQPVMDSEIIEHTVDTLLCGIAVDRPPLARPSPQSG